MSPPTLPPIHCPGCDGFVFADGNDGSAVCQRCGTHCAPPPEPSAPPAPVQ